MSGQACPKYVRVRVRVRGFWTCPCPKSRVCPSSCPGPVPKSFKISCPCPNPSPKLKFFPGPSPCPSPRPNSCPNLCPCLNFRPNKGSTDQNRSRFCQDSLSGVCLSRFCPMSGFCLSRFCPLSGFCPEFCKKSFPMSVYPAGQGRDRAVRTFTVLVRRCPPHSHWTPFMRFNR